MVDLEKCFGSNVFNETVMEQRLPEEILRAIRKTKEQGSRLDPAVADVVAAAMKDWAVERGVTHYTHWFQPLNSVTAEKHDSFISPAEGGRVILEFSGKELVRGETDASSFPSGGLRSTFEARGYTAWDPTSYAFIKDGVLCIPTAYCSYSGDVLDKKTPLLRSMEALNRQAMRILRLFGRDDVTRVFPTVGPEQEYFLIDRKLYEKRRDLVITGRTLFGARPPKGQDMSAHFFGSIKPRIQAFMNDLNEELWKLGVLAKTEHNETAPAQHEMAPIFTTVNIAADHNQLTMDIMKKVAERHGLVCLLAEKPFAGVNGSGKHNNWSMTTNTGYNLLNPGDSPHENAQFLLFLLAVVKAVDEHQDLLRAAVASAGNDYRLGGYEAPPAIISMFLGDELTDILDALETGTSYTGHEKSLMTVGVHALPKFPKDTTDRNRTSPFAFTGNKFEYRSVGSSDSISDTNTVLDTIVAESLRQFADELETADDFQSALHQLIVRTISEHKRIIFNGNNYAPEWKAEAEKRGLLCLNSTAEAMPCLIRPDNIALFERHRVLSASELRSRYEINLSTYAGTVLVEAETTLMIARREILPSVIRYAGDVASSLGKIRGLDMGIGTEAEESLLRNLSERIRVLSSSIDALQTAVEAIDKESDVLRTAVYVREHILSRMAEVRAAADSLEVLTDRSYWPFPTYDELLYSI